MKKLILFLVVIFWISSLPAEASSGRKLKKMRTQIVAQNLAQKWVGYSNQPYKAKIIKLKKRR